MTAGCNLDAPFGSAEMGRFLLGVLVIRQTFREFCVGQGKAALLSQWDAERNAPLTPDDVTFGSHKKIWWICKSGHSWQAAVYTRSSGTGCPYCAARRTLPGTGSLADRFPLLASEWDAEKNLPLTPETTSYGSHRLVWWRCPNGHSYRSTVKSRAQGTACPYCAGRAVLAEENSLAARFPDLAREWDGEKNGVLTPSHVLPGTHRKV